MSVKCKNCGAILPESLICEYCGADNSPEFKAKFNDKGMGTIKYNGETIRCYIESMELEQIYTDFSYRYLDGRLARIPQMPCKRIFTIKEW